MKKKYNKQRSFGYDKNGKRIIKWFHADSLKDLERQVENYRLQLKFTPNATNTRFEDYALQWLKAYKGNRSSRHRICISTHLTSVSRYSIIRSRK